MSYFKILRWMGGEGGDALLTSLMISHPSMISNVSSANQTDANARAIVNINLQMPINVIRMFNDIDIVDYRELMQEIDRLRSMEIDLILKSHLVERDLPSCIDILASDSTLDFFFAARMRKLGMKSMARNPEDFMLLKYDRELFLTKSKKRFINNITSMREKNDHLLIDDLLDLNYDLIESKINLELSEEGRSFLRGWVSKQLEMFPEELSSFRQ